MAKKFNSEANWKRWMIQRRSSRIQWVCDWHNIQSMTFSTMNHFGVAVVGISQVTFYFQTRYMRQFRQEQTKVLGNPEYAQSKGLDAKFCSSYLKYWPTRIMQDVAPCPKPKQHSKKD